MTKVVLKTALKTILAVLVVIIIGFTVLSLGFPKTMASFFEDGGSYSFAAGYASLSYSYSGDVADLARCVHDYIAADRDDKVSQFGDDLIKHENFSEYCKSETERLGLDYKQYVCGKIAVSKYKTGDKQGAMKTVDGALTEVGFPANNAFVQLLLTVKEKNDKDFGDELLVYVKTVTPKDSEAEYYDAIKSILEEFVK